jgi:hypothetical protein
MTQNLEFPVEQVIGKAMLRSATDPIARAVFTVLQENEFIDERGVIRQQGYKRRVDQAVGR